MNKLPYQQDGAVEACWAHNPEVNGSKPFPAKDIMFFPSVLVEKLYDRFVPENNIIHASEY